VTPEAKVAISGCRLTIEYYDQRLEVEAATLPDIRKVVRDLTALPDDIRWGISQ
jgi:hypothetical protein